jgi:hypothetical protein
MDSDHLHATRPHSGQLLPNLLSVSGELSHRLFAGGQLLLSERASSTILSLMDSLIIQIEATLDEEHVRQDNSNNERMAALFAEPGLILFLASRYYEWRCMSNAITGQGSSISKILSATLNIKGPYEELVARTISANARFAHNMEQFDIALDELPAELLHVLLGHIAANNTDGIGKNILSGIVTDEAQSRLVLNAKCAESFPLQLFTYAEWRDHGAILFLLGLADHLAIAYDNMILGTALTSPWQIMLSLRAANILPEDIVLILAEMPKGKQWLADSDFTDRLKLLAQGYTQERARSEIVQWDADQRAQNIPYCGHWPLAGGCGE